MREYPESDFAEISGDIGGRRITGFVAKRRERAVTFMKIGVTALFVRVARSTIALYKWKNFG